MLFDDTKKGRVNRMILPPFVITLAEPERVPIPVGPRRGKEIVSRVIHHRKTKIAHPIHYLGMSKKPNTNQMPSGICTAKRRWGSKGLGPRGRGRGRIATPWPLPRVSKPCGNGILSEIENNTKFPTLRISIFGATGTFPVRKSPKDPSFLTEKRARKKRLV